MNCPICSSVAEASFTRMEPPLLMGADASAVEVSYFSCGLCGHSFKSPMPSDDDLERYYSGVAGFETNRPARAFALAADWIAGTLDGLGYKHIASVLDVGAKGNELLAPICARVDVILTEAVGFDVSKRWTNRKSELVVASHVLEHVRDPIGFLSKLKDLSFRFVYVEVPAVTAINPDAAFHVLTKTHLHYFSAESLVAAGRAAGLHVHALAVSRPGGELNSFLRCMFSTVRLEDLPAHHKIDHLDYQRAKRVVLDLPFRVPLYPASEALSILAEEVDLSGRLIVDRDKAGKKLRGVEIQGLNALEGAKEVCITTRDWCMTGDILSYVQKHHPEAAVTFLFDGQRR